ncbi:MAG: class I SAM-dependent methyltransferase [Chlamydiales bacterium]
MLKIFNRIFEWIKLLLLNLKITLHQIYEYLRVIVKYYSHGSFYQIDIYLLLAYLFDNPFKVSKRFLLRKGDRDIYTYGETPLTTLDLLARRCNISAKDLVFELGCGRGRSCFWLNQLIGCRVVGIDYVPEFINRASKVKEKFHLETVEFRLEDILSTDLTGATVIYLYGTCLPDALILQLIQHLMRLPKGTKIITVSFSLADYYPNATFKVVDYFPASFTWGMGDVYLSEVS